MRYFVSLNRVTGRYTTGKYIYDGNFSYHKVETLIDAKNEVLEAFKRGYYNHAQIHDKLEDKTIERFSGTDWRTVKEDEVA